MSVLDALKTQAGYCDPTYSVCCRNCDHCVQLKRNWKCIRYGFIVSKDAVCREGFVARPSDSMVQRLYGKEVEDGEEVRREEREEVRRQEVQVMP